MTALAGEAIGVGTSWLTAGIDSMEFIPGCKSLAPYSAWRLVLRRHRSNSDVVPFLQFSFEDSADFGVCVVCDSKRNLNRFHRLVRMELPNNGRLRFRCATQVLPAGAACRSPPPLPSLPAPRPSP